MQIPSELPHPEKPTAMVVADTQGAKIFMLKDGEIEELKKIFFEEEWAFDKEGGFGQMSGGQVQSFGNPPVVPDEDHLLKDHVLKSLNEELFKRFQNKEFEEWYLIAPDYILKTVEEKMHSYLKRALVKKLAANLVNEHPLDILERLK
jgi:protein required for attachment to host cells